jgi:hypothetical protein
MYTRADVPDEYLAGILDVFARFSVDERYLPEFLDIWVTVMNEEQA